MRSTLLPCITAAIVGGLMLGLSTLALAGTEFVTVVKILSNDDYGIIVRGNGNAYQIEKGIGCLSGGTKANRCWCLHLGSSLA